MQLTLSDEEVHILTGAVKARIDELLRGTAKADSRAYKDKLIAEGGVLEVVYEKLGCVHTEWSEAKSCGFEQQ